MRHFTCLLLALILVAACSEDAAEPARSPAEAKSRAIGEDCVKPDDCQEGLWCLNGKCRKPLDRGMQRKEEMERIQDEHYQQFDDKVRSIEESLK